MHPRFPSVAVMGLAIAFGALVGTAQADPINVGDTIRFWDREGSTGGGEFGIGRVLPTPVTGELFRTFCIQRTEYIDFNAAGFKVAGITDHAVAGGDPLDTMTAFLYTKFRAGALTGYDYTAGSAARIASANAFQNAIWYIEQEPGISWSSLNTLARSFYNLALDATTAGGLTDEWVGVGIGNVRVMNLLWATTRGGFTAGTNAQDQLVLVPTPTASLAGCSLLGAWTALVVLRMRSSTARAKRTTWA